MMQKPCESCMTITCISFHYPNFGFKCVSLVNECLKLVCMCVNQLTGLSSCMLGCS